MLLGSATALEARFQTFRLISLTLTPWNLAIETQLFYHISPSSQRFWPLSILCFHPCQEMLERNFPIKTYPSILGWGKIDFSYETLKAFIRVKWNGQIWTLSEDGKIWLESQNMESRPGEQELPLIEWGNDLPPAFINETDRVVYDSDLPLTKIRKWLDGLAETKWGEGPTCITVKESTGGLILGLHQKFGHTEIRLILPEDTIRWSQTFQAFREIKQRLTGQEKWVQIDATYGDKIVVKRDIL